MKRNWLEWLAAIFYPCAHQWERLDTLKDNDENPNAVKIIRMCSICGVVDEVLISAPPNGECRHKWEQTDSINIISPNAKPNAVPAGQVRVFTCSLCGETKARKITSEGFEDATPQQQKKKANQK